MKCEQWKFMIDCSRLF